MSCILQNFPDTFNVIFRISYEISSFEFIDTINYIWRPQIVLYGFETRQGQHYVMWIENTLEHENSRKEK